MDSGELFAAALSWLRYWVCVYTLLMQESYSKLFYKINVGNGRNILTSHIKISRMTPVKETTMLPNIKNKVANCRNKGVKLC
ncbi:MAG: hypothetical protein Kow0080_11070 [Candidatus Promineifilaceae bacterium]